MVLSSIEVSNEILTVNVMIHAPRLSDIYLACSRRGNIPGYSGCVLFSSHHPTHSKEPDPKATTTARIHRYVLRSIVLLFFKCYDCL